MDPRLFHRGWQVLAVLGALGVLLVVLVPASVGGGSSSALAPGTATTMTLTAIAVTATTSPSTTSASATTSTSTTSSTTSTSTTSTTLPLFTKQHPLRVLVVGDSLMTYPAYALADQMKVYSGLQVESVTKQSSGLVRPDYYDWPTVLGRAVRQFRPHVVVILLGANDQQPVLHKGRSAATFSDVWNQEYAKRIDQFIQIATSSGGSVVWVGLPIMRDAKFSNVERRLNALYAAGCATRPGAVYIDGYELFSGADGKYAASLADAAGVVRTMRARDGIHFTMDGARRIAEAVVEVLLRSCRLEQVSAQPAVSAKP